MHKIPILYLNSVLIASIQTELTDDEIVFFQSELLERNHKLTPKGIIIDVSTLDVIDSYMAKILHDLMAMVKLQGSTFVLCGVKPAVSSTLVDMGMMLDTMSTFLSLDHAFNYLSTTTSNYSMER
jgi:rsbT antagonist protein RsbS